MALLPVDSSPDKSQENGSGFISRLSSGEAWFPVKSEDLRGRRPHFNSSLCIWTKAEGSRAFNWNLTSACHLRKSPANPAKWESSRPSEAIKSWPTVSKVALFPKFPLIGCLRQANLNKTASGRRTGNNSYLLQQEMPQRKDFYYFLKFLFIYFTTMRIKGERGNLRQIRSSDKFRGQLLITGASSILNRREIVWTHHWHGYLIKYSDSSREGKS